jgi:hypothetical protein
MRVMRRVLFSFFFLLIIALVAGGALFFREFNRVFPPLAPGVYAGFIKPAQQEGFPWFVEVLPNSSDVLVSAGSAALPAQRALIMEPSRSTRLPLIISGEGRRLRITGEASEDGQSKGEFSDPISGEKGAWTLKRIVVSDLASDAQSALVAWGAAWTVANGYAVRATEVRLKNDESRARIASLKEAVTKQGEVRAPASGGAVKPALPDDKEQREIAVKKGELESLIQNLSAGNKVSPAGRLAVLSRESIEREAAWIENALDLTAPEAAAGFDAQYERALRVKALQDQIADERGLIKNLTEAPTYRREGAEINEEEAFYNGLQ